MPKDGDGGFHRWCGVGAFGTFVEVEKHASARATLQLVYRRTGRQYVDDHDGHRAIWVGLPVTQGNIGSLLALKPQ